MSTYFVKIPCNDSLPITQKQIKHAISKEGKTINAAGTSDGGADAIPIHLKHIIIQQLELTGKEDHTNGRKIGEDDLIVDATPLIRMEHPDVNQKISVYIEGGWESKAGLFVYSITSTIIATYDQSNSVDCADLNETRPNVRATRLAMACGLHSQRFYGDVHVGRLGYVPRSHVISKSAAGDDLVDSGFILANLNLQVKDIIAAACFSPDLRDVFLQEVQLELDAKNNSNNTDVAGATDETKSFDDIRKPSVPFSPPPEWLANASQRNYKDGSSISALVVAMTRSELHEDVDDEVGDDETSTSSSSYSHETEQQTPSSPAKLPLTETTLCLHCRGPASTMCTDCEGAYFCDEPRECKVSGWSHQCLCPTWRVYTKHRLELSTFSYFSGWHLPLFQKDCFTSESIYEKFLNDLLGVSSVASGQTLPADSETSSALTKETIPNQTWWSTELHGWSGGSSLSAKHVNYFHRVTYQEGFALSDPAWIPEERHVTLDDIRRANESHLSDLVLGEPSGVNDKTDGTIEKRFIKIDQHGLPILKTWEHYYRIRSLPPSSPVALLATFPLSIYYAIQHYGIVPLTVAKMMDRPLRIHVVGIEKELNFLDWFRELGYLIPESSDVNIDMTFVVREDMFPRREDVPQESVSEMHSTSASLSMQLTTNLRLSIVGGTYGESLDPNFDISYAMKDGKVEGGQPDMVIGLNAGLFAYKSWSYVISYLGRYPNVTGVFTDYNEHSGVNCASLGGGRSRNSLKVNPFRQPRAMPVYCMNLPQMSNAFFYVFNEQELDE